MAYDPHRHHRQSVRRPDHDYRTAGIYYITICTHERECLFGDICGKQMRLNAWGEVVQDEWLKTSSLRSNVVLDAFVIMPNHLHGLLVVNTDGTADNSDQESGTEKSECRFAQPQSASLGRVVGAFKAAVARRINALRETPGAPVWQRNYHERIVGDEQMLDNARRYIACNPARWTDDVENPANVTIP